MTILRHGYLTSIFRFFVTGLALQSGYCLGLGGLYLFLEGRDMYLFDSEANTGQGNWIKSMDGWVDEG